MFCTKCGTPNADNIFNMPTATILQSPTEPQQSLPRPRRFRRLAPAILITLFCCLPFGIVTIVMPPVSSKVAAGDIRGATGFGQGQVLVLAGILAGADPDGDLYCVLVNCGLGRGRRAIRSINAMRPTPARTLMWAALTAARLLAGACCICSIRQRAACFRRARFTP